MGASIRVQSPETAHSEADTISLTRRSRSVQHPANSGQQRSISVVIYAFKSSDMETSERLTSRPSLASSFASVSSSSSSRTLPSKSSPAVTSLFCSSLNTYGGSQAFGLYTSSLGNTQFEELKLSSVLVAHSHFRKIPDLNETVNDSNSQSGKASVNTDVPLFATKKKQEKYKKSSLEAVSLSGSLSGSVSGISENEDSSSDPEDMEEEGDGSDASESDRNNGLMKTLPGLTHGTSDAQKKTPCGSPGSADQHRDTTKDQQNRLSVPSMSSLHHLGPLLSTPSGGNLRRPSITSAKGQGWLFLDPKSPPVSSANALFLALSDLPKFSVGKPMHRPLMSSCVRNSLKDIPSRGNHRDRNALEKPMSRSCLSTQDTHLRKLTSQTPPTKTLNLSSLHRHFLSSPTTNNTAPFFNIRTNGFIQDAPLALVTKPRERTDRPTASHSQSPEPINLSTSSGERCSVPSFKVTDGSLGQPAPSKRVSGQSQPGIEDSDDSLEDDTEDSDSNTSDSGSSVEINSESEDDVKESSEVNSDGHGTRQKLAKSFPKSSPSPSANCSLLSTDILKTSCPPMGSFGSAAAMSNLNTLKNYNSTASSTAVPLPAVQRRRVTDEKALRVPLAFGWQRVTRVQAVGGRLQGEVCYYAPCGKKLRQYPDVMKYLSRHGIVEISRDNFSFSTKIKLGDFYKAKEGPEGFQWIPLAEEEIAPCIVALDGRRQRKAQAQQSFNAAGVQPLPYLQDVSDAKLLRKLEAQEIARCITQMKMMRKLEKQALAKAAKEAKRQQALLAAEERRKKKEQIKILKQQEKIRRIQQIRLEKEVRAQQILEAKKKKKEEAANAKLLEAEKRGKEREMRRMNAVFQKHQLSSDAFMCLYIFKKLFYQEMERHRLDIVWEREKRRQHLMLLKEAESRKKAEEKERLKKERKDEKLLNKERKLELRRLELEKAKELKKPREDLCLTDHRPLPELSRIPGLVLSGRTISDCLTVLQFVHSFGAVLSLNTLSLSELQEGLLNLTDKVQELLVALVSAAVRDPSLVQAHKMKTALGELLSSVMLDSDNVSEVLRLFMESHCDPDSYASTLALSLRTKDFRALQPSDKASILAFLVNELCCCKAVVSEIDKNIDNMAKLRKEKWIVEGVLRKLKNIHAKKMGRKPTEGTQACNDHAAGNKRKRREGDSEEEEDEDEDSDGEEVEEDEGKTSKKTAEQEDENIDSASVEELEKEMEKATEQHTEIRQKLLESSYSLRPMMMGQDRYKRCYWLLPQCGGVFVEGSGTQQGYGDVLKEKRHGPGHERSTKGEHLMKCQSLSLFCQLPKKASTTSYPQTSGHSKLLTNDFCISSNPRVPRNTNLHFLSPKFKNSSWTSASAPLDHDSSVFVNQWISHLPPSCDHDSHVPPSSSSQTLLAHSASSAHSPSAESDMQQQHVQSDTHQGRGILCDMSSELTSPSLPFTGSSVSRMGDLASQHAQGKAHSVPFQTSYSSVSETDPREPPSDGPRRAWSPAEEVARSQEPVPEDMLSGWWWMSNVEEVQNLSKALHCRGIRERALTKQIHKHMEYMAQLCAHKNAAVIDAAALHKQTHCKEMVDMWCVQEEAIKSDICALKQVEALEMRVISAGLQVKGWTPPEPQSQWEDLVYHKLKSPSSRAQQPNSSLDRAVCRLAQLEKNIERRCEEEDALWRRLWHKALSEVQSPAQLVLCVQQLQKTISWDRTLMKVQCQVCHRGDDEESLLLCDGCDKACHVDCHEPKIPCIPEGDWFCPVCLNKSTVGLVLQANVNCPQTRQRQSQTSGGGKMASKTQPYSKPSVSGELIKEEAAHRSSHVPKKSVREVKKRKAAIGLSSSEANHDNPGSKKAKKSRHGGSTDELEMCQLVLGELEEHQDVWTFLKPVNLKSVPG